MVNLNIFEKKYGWVQFNGKVYILKELMKPTGIMFSNNVIETSANATDDNYNNYKIYWRINKSDIKNPNYDEVVSIEKIVS